MGKESIQLIQQTAEETRQMLLVRLNEYIHQAKQKLNEIAKQLRQRREEGTIIEIDLQNWKVELQQMTEQLNKPSTITIQQSSASLINKIQVELPG